MPVPLSNAQRTALQGDHVQFVRLLELHFGGGNVWYLTAAPYAVSWNSQTWVPGIILSLNAFKQQSNANAAPWSVTLSAIDPALRTIMVSENFEQNLMTFYRGIVDVDTKALIGDPLAVVERKMNAGEFIRLSGDTDMAFIINGISPWEGKIRGGHRVTTHQDQLVYARALTGNANYVDTAFKDRYPSVGLMWPGGGWTRRS